MNGLALYRLEGALAGSSRPHRAILALVLVGTAVLAAGCHRAPSIGADVVVTIEDEEVTYGEFESHLRDNVGGDLPNLGTEVLDALFDQFVDERLLVRLARERGLKGQGASVDRRQAVRFLLSQAPLEPVDDATIAAYYEAHREDYARPEGVRLRQILAPDRETAEQAVAALANGEDFAQVAARFSQVPMAGLAGEDGRLTRDDLPEAFVDPIFALEPGEVSEILEADYGFHIFQVEERFPADHMPLEKVRDEIRDILERQRVDEQVGGLVAAARQRYNVEVHRSNFPFDYRGFYADDE